MSGAKRSVVRVRPPGYFDDDPVYRAEAALFMIYARPSPYVAVREFAVDRFELAKWVKQAKSGSLERELKQYGRILLEELKDAQSVKVFNEDAESIVAHARKVERLREGLLELAEET